MSDQPSDKHTVIEGPVLAVGVAAAVFAVLCATAVSVLAILTLLGPAIGNVFSHQLGVQECSFETDVVVFEDANSNQVQDTGEDGIKDVNIYLTVDSQIDLVEQTDEAGLVHLWWYNPSCKTAKSFEVIVDVPSGYQATTVTTFGPYVVTFIGSPGVPVVVGLK